MSMLHVKRLLILLYMTSSLSGCETKKPAPDVSPPPAPQVAKPAPRPMDPMFGSEIGLDHLGVAVKDLAKAKETFIEKLGFRNPQEGRLPNGLDNVVFYFRDATYIELLGVYDAKKAGWYASFLEKFEGIVFYVMAISDVAHTAAHLKKHGAELKEPRSGTIQMKGSTEKPKEQWQTFFLKGSPIKWDPFFFIWYRPEHRQTTLGQLRDPAVRQQLRHANSGLRLSAVWHAAPDLAQAVKDYERIGFTAGRRFTEPRLQADGRVITAGQGSILLLAPQDEKSIVATFIKERRRPMSIGMTVEVARLEAVRAMLHKTTSKEFAVTDGPQGSSILVPPEVAHGIWLEFVQRSGRRP